ncbi:broad-complex core protein isoforms 1/2/3/4/5-like isoform X3 [Nasonia vitripennis]|uniref:Uncharacterized protein n=1 Tax=Nasonia vitripennis TaxID=7425 RepID=A0A7M7IP53_NASVI|nr:broad-complex core protein isoforms 1/2/3/4/5-like isoform X3 [Nasonia vitripennis]
MPPTLCFATTPFADSSEFSTMSSDQQYCLRWNNHSLNFVTVFESLLKAEAFTDVTVAADGVQIKCHKMVLAACSTYFQELFVGNPCEHPVILLSNVTLNEIKAILDYMYKGEVNVSQEDLAGLLKAASDLRIKGLVEDPDKHKRREEPPTRVTPPPANNPSHSATNNQALGNGSHILKNGWDASGTAVPESPHPVSGPPPPRSQHLNAGTSHHSNEIKRDNSPLSRKKLTAIAHVGGDTPILRNVLGQSHHLEPSALDRQEASCSTNSNGSYLESDRRSSAELSESMEEEENRGQNSSPPYPNVNLNVIAMASGKGKSGVGKPEWKRYKQYTRENIQEAMDAVRNKRMSALQAARKYGVPSRTLYDKLKKAGILPSRGAGVARQRCEPAVGVMDNGSARFPYSSSVNGSVYGHSALSENDSDNNGMHNAPVVVDMSTRSPSPAQPPQHFVAPAIVHQDDQVEDLSIARSSSSSSRSRDNTTPVIVPSTSAIKKEPEDTDMA